MRRLDRLLKFDPLDTAEIITGHSIHEDNSPATALGFLLLQEQAATKDRVLREQGDTVFNNTLERYLEIIQREGFILILEQPFKTDDRVEANFIFGRPDKGWLLHFDTYGGDRVNGGKVYYNWLPTEGIELHRYTSSGGFREGVWVGDHDCREALIHNLNNLGTNGVFVSPWKEKPFLWFLHHGHTRNKGYDYEKINAEIISMFPSWALEMIGAKQ